MTIVIIIVMTIITLLLILSLFVLLFHSYHNKIFPGECFSKIISRIYEQDEFLLKKS